jgi:hypothetical protein
MVASHQEAVVAVGLLTQTHLDMLGTSLKRVFPIADDSSFEDLLQALDELDSEDRD